MLETGPQFMRPFFVRAILTRLSLRRPSPVCYTPQMAGLPPALATSARETEMNFWKTMRRAADKAATRPEDAYVRQGLRHARLDPEHPDRAPDAPGLSDVAHALKTRRMMPPVMGRR